MSRKHADNLSFLWLFMTQILGHHTDQLISRIKIFTMYFYVHRGFLSIPNLQNKIKIAWTRNSLRNLNMYMCLTGCFWAFNSDSVGVRSTCPVPFLQHTHLQLPVAWARPLPVYLFASMDLYRSRRNSWKGNENWHPSALYFNSTRGLTHKNVPDKPKVVLVVAKFQGENVNKHIVWLGGDRTSRLEAERSVESRHHLSCNYWGLSGLCCFGALASSHIK